MIKGELEKHEESVTIEEDDPYAREKEVIEKHGLNVPIIKSYMKCIYVVMPTPREIRSSTMDELFERKRAAYENLQTNIGTYQIACEVSNDLLEQEQGPTFIKKLKEYADKYFNDIYAIYVDVCCPGKYDLFTRFDESKKQQIKRNEKIKHYIICAMKSYGGNWVIDSFGDVRMNNIIKFVWYKLEKNVDKQCISECYDEVLKELAEVDVKPF